MMKRAKGCSCCWKVHVWLLLALLFLVVDAKPSVRRRRGGSSNASPQPGGSAEVPFRANNATVEFTEEELALCPYVQLLVGDDCVGFVRTMWEEKPQHRHESSPELAKLMSTPILKWVFDTWRPNIHPKDHGQVVVLRAGSFQHDEAAFPHGSPITFDQAHEAVMKHSRTVVMHNTELYWPVLGEFVTKLGRFFKLYAQSNVYWTGPGHTVATSPHQDAQSVFIVQVEGEKRWQVFRPPSLLMPKPLQRGKANDVLSQEHFGQAVVDVVLKPGDVLFVPRAWPHTTSTANASQPSLHITVGVETESDDCCWAHILAEALPKAKEAIMERWTREVPLRRHVPRQLLRPAQSIRGTEFQQQALDLLTHTQRQAALHDADRFWRAIDEAIEKRRDLVRRKHEQIARINAAVLPKANQ